MAEPVVSSRGVGLMYCGVSRYDDSWGSVLHSHDHAELFYIMRGQGFLHITGDTIPLKENDCFLINPYVMHTEVSSPNEPLEYIVIGLKRIAFHGDDDTSRYTFLGDRSNPRVLLPYFQDLLRELSMAHQDYLEVCADILNVLLLKLRRKVRIDVSEKDGEHISSECAEAKRMIDEHFQEQVTLDWLSSVTGISKFYLSRTFHTYYNMSPMQYLCFRRIQEARHLLATTDHSLDTISMLSGFSSQSYFSQAFKRVAGMNPSEYRKIIRTEKQLS